MNKEGWIALGIQVVVMALTVGVCYATAITRIEVIENRLNARNSDHDILLKLDQKVDILTAEVMLLRIDFKEMVKRNK